MGWQCRREEEEEDEEEEEQEEGQKDLRRRPRPRPLAPGSASGEAGAVPLNRSLRHRLRVPLLSSLFAVRLRRDIRHEAQL